MSDQVAGPKINIIKDGPYMVSGGVRLTRAARVYDDDLEPIEWEWGEDLEPRDVHCLCRCGASSTKPYCDGHHVQMGFDGTLSADRAPGATRREVFTGEGIVMTDDRSLCAGYGFCHPHGGVWEQMKDTADPEVRARVERQILDCPTARLEFSRQAGGEPVEEEREPTIAITPNGGLWVIGGIPVIAPDGFVYEIHNRVVLCRCGGSPNKPFCDGSHKKVGFKEP